MHFQTGTLLGSGTYTVIANYDAANSRLSADPAFVTKICHCPTRNYFFVSGILPELSSMRPMTESGSLCGHQCIRNRNARVDERIVFGSGSKKEHWSTAIRAMGFDAGAPLLGTPGFPREEKGENRRKQQRRFNRQ